MKWFLILAIVGGLVAAVLLARKINAISHPPSIEKKLPTSPTAAAVGNEPKPIRPEKVVLPSDAVNGAPLETPPLALHMVRVPLKFTPAGEMFARLATEGKTNSSVEVRQDDSETALLLSGTDFQHVSAFAEIVRQMDVASAIVGVRCLIVRDDSGKSLQEGLFAFLEGVQASTSGGWGDLLSGMTYDLTTGVASFGSALAARQILDLVTSCVAGNTKYHVLSEPNVSVLSGRNSVFSSGREVPVPVIQRDQTGSQTSIVYKKAEFRFEVVPVVLPSGAVRVQLKQSNSDVLAQVQIGGSTVPVLSAQSLESSVDLRENQLLYLGGIDVINDTGERRGIPILRDIPLVGFLVGRKETEFKKSRLSVMLSVKVYRPGEVPAQVMKAIPVRQSATKKPPRPIYAGKIEGSKPTSSILSEAESKKRPVAKKPVK